MARDTTSDGAANDNKAAGAAAIRVIDYNKASPSDRAEMDKLIAAIDENPEKYELIRTFGLKPMDEMAKAADKAIQSQQKYSEAFTVYSGTIKHMKEGMRAVEGVVKESMGALKALGTAVGKGTTKGMSMIGKTLKWLSRDRKEVTDEEKEIESLEEGLRTQVTIIAKLYSEMSEAIPTLKRAHDEAMDQGKSVAKTNMDLGLYVGAGREMLRRYDEDIIPAAKDVMDDPNTPNPMMAAQTFDMVLENRDHMQQRINDLQGSQVLGQNTMSTMHNFTTNIRRQLSDIDSLNRVGLPMIKLITADAGRQAVSLKTALLQQATRAEAERILDSQLSILQKTNEILDRMEARGGGLISTEKLIETTQRTNQMLEDSNNAKREKRRLLEEQSGALTELAEGQNAFARKQRQLEDSGISSLSEKATKERKEGKLEEEFKKAIEQQPTPAAKDPTPAQDNMPVETDRDREAADQLRARRKSGGTPKP